MSLNQRVEALIELGHFREALSYLDSQPSTPSSMAATKVYLISHAGSLLRAQAAAEALLRKETDERTRVTCKEVIGRSLLVHGGSVEEGLRFLIEARDEAAAKLGVVSHARLACQYVDALLHRVGIQEALAEISDLRRIVLASGDVSSLIVAHLLQAEIRIKQAHMARASADLRIAKDLLTRQPNLFFEGKWALASSAHAALDGQLSDARSFAESAVDCAERTGSIALKIPALGTLGHVLLALGELDQCHRKLNEAERIARPGGATLIGLLDTRLQLLMARGSDDIASMADRLVELSDRFEHGHSYYGLWHVLTRLKWLLRTGRAEEAVTLALDSLPHAERLADRNLLERMQLLAAEALGATGHGRDGAARLAHVLRHNPDPSLELVAEAARVAGCLAAPDDPDAARAHFERAVRICHAVGQRTAAADIVRRAPVPLDTPADAPGPRRERHAPAHARLVEASAAITHLAAHPPLLGVEVIDLLTSARAASAATLVEEDQTGVRRVVTAVPASGARRPPASPYSTPIPLGTLGTRTYELLVEPGPGPADQATVAAAERLTHTAVTLSRMRRDERERTSLWPEPSPEEQLGLICASEGMRELVKTTRRIAPTNVTVLITGETGAGKEVIARALHQASGRQARAFVPFNCTTVPREMLDSQLFGYRRGAFTGAVDEYPGLIRSAEGGTLFLDEIGEMPQDLQPKLLRFLESNEVLPLGETRPIRVDVRVVAATNADLEHLVNEGRFREDLYYRLNVIRLKVPPLRERREEVPLLVQALVERFARENQREPIRVSDEVMEYLALYHWPGNARQLANELRRLSALADPGALIMPEHLSPEIAASRRAAASEQAAARRAHELLVRTDQPLSAATEHVERVLIAQALDQCQGNLERAAQTLGLSRKGLFLKRQRLGLG